METSQKICISLLIFSPAFIYFLYAVSKSPVVDNTKVFRESDMIFVPQRFDSEEREDAMFLADKYNQNIWPREYTGEQINRVDDH
ncbi:hypothetical protein Y032_0382g372 [Ancylostoma ceylanicum]|uniref:Uncharacterized protein n=1 Tax=Ancylostoma ceylanicum TaxID=53326 RepID=A0A016RU45_9BILA|nr:hypothetical protein Y032_0382g372 [Ancylostoma ceylanicum]